MEGSTVSDPRLAPGGGGGAVPHIFKPNRGTKGPKKFYGDRPPPHLISRSGFGNGLFGGHYTWILIITSCEQRAKRPPGPPFPVFSVIQSFSLPARSRSWSPRSCRKQERDRLVRKTTPLPERNELTPSVKETKCNFRRTSPALISE